MNVIFGFYRRERRADQEWITNGVEQEPIQVRMDRNCLQCTNVPIISLMYSVQVSHRMKFVYVSFVVRVRTHFNLHIFKWYTDDFIDRWLHIRCNVCHIWMNLVACMSFLLFTHSTLKFILISSCQYCLQLQLFGSEFTVMHIMNYRIAEKWYFWTIDVQIHIYVVVIFKFVLEFLMQ